MGGPQARDRGGGRDVVSMVLLTIMVVAGLAVAFYWIYERLEDIARKTTRMAQSVVLDVQGADSAGEEQEQPQQQEQADASSRDPPTLQARRSLRLAEQAAAQQRRGGDGVAGGNYEPLD